MFARNFLIASVAAFAISSSAAQAADCSREQLEKVRSELKKYLPNTPVDELKCGPVAGLHTVLSGQNVLYTVDGKQLVIGGIYDLVNRQDLTQPDRARLAPTSVIENDTRSFANERRINMALLPKASFTMGKAGGEKIYMFSDPNCGFCTRAHMGLEAAIEAGANIELHVIPVALLRSEAKVRTVLCAKDPQKAMKWAMSAHEVASPVGDCGQSQMEANTAGMKRLGFQGTPTFVREDGAVMAGWEGEAKFMAWVAAGSDTRVAGFPTTSTSN